MKLVYYKFNCIVFLFFCFLFNSFEGLSQKTKIMGTVWEASTNQPLPFVSVYVKQLSIATMTDFNGKYSLEFTENADSLTASYMGYETVVKPITLHKFQEIDFTLLEKKFYLNEVVIKPTENPAEILLKKIINNKKQNSSEDISYYQYETYNKIEFDANNISEEFKEKRMLKQFQFIFDNVDTSTLNGKSYLPVFLTETLSEIYYRKSPKAKKEFIKASKISGIENESISQFVGEMYQDVNIYDNYVILFDKNFVSPIANFGIAYYKYYLTDSTNIDGKWCYNIMFKPRRKQELTFTGNLWVCDTSFAIKKIEMRIADDANINFINDIIVEQEFDFIDHIYWMLTKDKMVADFNIVNNTKNNLGFYGIKTTSFKNYIFDKPKEESFYNTPMNITVVDGSTKQDDSFWLLNRHDSLSKDEKAVYKMVDSIKTIKVFRTYVDIIQTIFLGYYVWENIEIGPYFSTFSFNEVEGARFRIGGRTSNQFSTKIMFDAHLAYGLKDQTFKYGGGFIYMFNKNPRRSLTASYKNDIEQLGESQNSFITDNILASLLRRSPNNQLTMVKEFKSIYENEWFNGFSTTIGFINRNHFPLGETNFVFLKNGQQEFKPSLTTTELVFNTRFAYNEKFVFGEFERTSMGTKYPILELKYGYGKKDIFNSDYEYHRLQLAVNHWFNVSSIGWSKYLIQAGKIWGVLPYPLLKLHEGNETWVFDDYAFNMMNYYEFISDQYLSFYYTHHFEGLFFNRIPLLRKLKWREVASIRGLTGTLNEKNQQYNVAYLNEYNANSFMFQVNKPYFEAGVGIENILKIFRINAMWRLSYLDHPNISKFGIMGTMQLYF